MGRLEDQEERAALLHALRTSTEVLARLATGIVNNVLEVRSGVIPTSGRVELEWPVAPGAIRVRNRSASNAMTVAAGGGQANTPTGLGTAVIPFGQVETVAMASREITLYGTAGDGYNIQVFTAAVTPTSS